MSEPSPRSTAFASLLVVGSLVSQNVGAAFAKRLFPSVGADGMAALRVGLAAALLLGIVRPWRGSLTPRERVQLVAYGATLGLMNLLIYRAFERVPIGVAIAIEITGPLFVVLVGSRRFGDFVWLACAALGLGLLLPLRAGFTSLDPAGVAYAAGASVCWALYIVFGKRVAHLPRGQAVAWGMPVAALVTVPLGIAHAGPAMGVPYTWCVGLGVAVLSSALPYSLEMVALRTLPRNVFGILVSTAPALGALASFLVIGERLSGPQWLAVAFIVVASAGSAAASARARKPSAEVPVPTS